MPKGKRHDEEPPTDSGDETDNTLPRDKGKHVIKKRRSAAKKSPPSVTFPLTLDIASPSKKKPATRQKRRRKNELLDNDDGLIEDITAVLLLPVSNGTGSNDDDNGIFINGLGDGDNDSWTSAPPTRQTRKKKKNAQTTEFDAKVAAEEKSIRDYIKEHELDYENQDLRKQIILMNAPVHVKAMLLGKYDDINKKSGLSFGNSADRNKFQSWIKDVLTVPYGKTRKLPVALDDGTEKIKAFLEEMRGKLDSAVAGHDHAKAEIIDYIARMISNPQGKGNIIALCSAPGVGKTRMLRRGVAEALGRPFHVINLGGLNDVHVLTGHDMTYSGAKMGRVVQILVQSKCENPIVYLDEIDKIQASSDKGMEIFRVLTHILDEEQNETFMDEYLGGIPVDLSKILFVASMNNANDVEPVLRDRLKIIRLDKLTVEQKMKIAYDYVLPELAELVAFDLSLVEIPREVMLYIINEKTVREDGCRQMKRKLETIIQKLNTMRITRSGYYCDGDTCVRLGETDVNTLLAHTEEEDAFPMHMYS